LELQKLPILGDIDYKELVQKSKGFSGAEMVAICNEAALFAIDRDVDTVSQVDLVTAASKIKPQITAEMNFFYATFAAKNKI
jgi:AAA family ATPase